MNKVLDRFHQIAASPYMTAREWKNKTRSKVVGCMGLYVPEVIIHAAGMLPVIAFETEKPIVKAQNYVQSFMCGYIRSVMEQVLEGELDFLDCLVVHDCCHVIRMTSDIIRRNSNGIGKVRQLFFPITIRKQQALSYTITELEGFSKDMGLVSGEIITEEKLVQSIRVYNRNRRLLKKLYQLRRDNPGLLSAVQVSEIVKAGMVMPKEEHSLLLEELIDLLVKERTKVDIKGKVPLVVSGSLCETCDTYVLELLEEAGGVVVDDDLYVGFRYFATEIDEILPPIEALAKAYLHMSVPCPTRHDPENSLSKYLIDKVNNVNAKGVVNVVVKFCEAHDYAYYLLRRSLREQGIKECLIETEHELTSPAQIKTRIQSFIENLKEEGLSL